MTAESFFHLFCHRFFSYFKILNFTRILSDYLSGEYKKHLFTVLTYDAVSGDQRHVQAFVGYCVYKYDFYGRNCVVCHGSKKSNFPTIPLERIIWRHTLHTVEETGVSYISDFLLCCLNAYLLKDY